TCVSADPAVVTPDLEADHHVRIAPVVFRHYLPGQSWLPACYSFRREKETAGMTATITSRIVSGVAIAAALAVLPAHASVLEQTKKVRGVTVRYKVVLPDGYDAAKTYPAILAFGGGPQTMNTVDGVLNRNLRIEAEKRGYIVIAPAAPDGQLFFESGARIFPEFLKRILAEYKIEGARFHIAGPSNGGIAAFHVA